MVVLGGAVAVHPRASERGSGAAPALVATFDELSSSSTHRCGHRPEDCSDRDAKVRGEVFPALAPGTRQELPLGQEGCAHEGERADGGGGTTGSSRRRFLGVATAGASPDSASSARGTAAPAGSRQPGRSQAGAPRRPGNSPPTTARRCGQPFLKKLRRRRADRGRRREARLTAWSSGHRTLHPRITDGPAGQLPPWSPPGGKWLWSPPAGKPLAPAVAAQARPIRAFFVAAGRSNSTVAVLPGYHHRPGGRCRSG